MPKPTKQTVKCPGCETEVEIYGDGDGVCSSCDLNVQAIYERARHEKALKKVMDAPAPEPTPAPIKKKGHPFDFRM